MIHTSEGRLEVSGGMTLDVASRLLGEGAAAVALRDTVVDLGAVEAVDSSALAVIFGWMRAAAAQSRHMTLTHPPAQLMSLAELYGVAELLPIA